MLSKFTGMITGGKIDSSAALLGVSQFLLPLVVLLGCAFLLSGSLIWAGAGMASVLIVLAVIRFIKAALRR